MYILQGSETCFEGKEERNSEKLTCLYEIDSPSEGTKHVRSHKRDSSRTKIIMLYNQRDYLNIAELLYLNDGTVLYSKSWLYGQLRIFIQSKSKIRYSLDPYYMEYLPVKKSIGCFW